MMKSKHCIYIFLTLCTSLAAGSCADEALVGNGSYGDSGNTIRFDVSSGFGNAVAVSRSGGYDADDSDGLAPVLFSEGSDTLYLHRYVAPEAERATGHNAMAISRSAQVNSPADFRTVNGESGFRVKAMFTAGNKEYFPFSTAVPLASETSGSPDDVWHVTDPCRYWPDGHEFRFYAYAPASAENLFQNLTLDGDNITFDYTVPVSAVTPRCDAERQPDIMLATIVCCHTMGAGHSDLVPLNFRHALSAIKFAVRDVTDGEIVDISIKGVAGSGSCSFTAEDGFTWHDLGETTDYVQTFNYGTEDNYSENIPIVDIGMPEKTFMLIPQEIPEDAVLEITFRTKNGINKTLSGKLKTSDIPLWEAGKEYIYTISTSSENWTYVFNVKGSVQTENDKEPAKGAFNDDPNRIIVNPTVTEGAYYQIQSYRYRTNKPSVEEEVAWTAVSTAGENTVPDKFSNYGIGMTVEPKDWFPEMTFTDEVGTTFGDSGSKEFCRYNLVFSPQYVATDWAGDWAMRNKAENGTKSSPIDLSMRNGGKGVRNTANCYVVNAGGWYTIPLYYGNSKTGGKTNTNAYVRTVNHTERGYKSLMEFVGYDGQPISGPEITGAEGAVLVWEDAYGIIDEIELDKTKTPNEVKFHIAKENLQQSNSIVAVRDDKGQIMWSWHIWVTEHWVDDDLVLDKGIECEAWDEGKGPFYVAPRNLGWCDPKNVQYLERTGSITFTQEKIGKKHTLAVKQRGKLIEFWVGNNAYYQYGRKDPFVGYINESNDLKYNFGEMPYKMAEQGREIKEGILAPNVLFVGGKDAVSNNDWLTTNYYNLWNNYQGTQLTKDTTDPNSGHYQLYTDFAYSAVKTIYDPSPAGFVVPPVDFFKLFTSGIGDQNHPNTNISNFNGTYTNLGTRKDVASGKTRFFLQLHAYTKRNKQGEALIMLNSTGHRWYTERIWGVGGNSNPHVVYLWSNMSDFNADHSAYTLAIGQEWPGGNDEDCTNFQQIVSGNNFCINAHFAGRKCMARPVRCVREFQ